MTYLPNILFLLSFVAGIGYFTYNIRKLKRNIKLGKDIDRSDQPKERWRKMTLLALGQSKMVRRPVSGILHIIVYVGFIIINIEVLEIIIDGLLGTHRIFSVLEVPYTILISSFEILALLVLVSVIIFWTRRNLVKIKRFWYREMKEWPKKDANNILYIEAVLMVLFLFMNGADLHLQSIGAPGYVEAGHFPISQFITPVFAGLSMETVIILERSAWWLHILGILFFLNYLYFSKHLHILLAFPNTYYSKLTRLGKFPNNPIVTKEVELMMDPNADPFASPSGDAAEPPEKFGASDVMDLHWVQLLNAYTCTECGLCTSQCPASQTGKKLSPRKIMMDTRDRLEEVGKNIDKNGEFLPDGKQLLDDYILREELWACTTCNACVEVCPVSIDPLSIIMDMRQYLVMEQSAAPSQLNSAMTNIENNAAPWPYNQMDRLKWKEEV